MKTLVRQDTRLNLKMRCLAQVHQMSGSMTMRPQHAGRNYKQSQPEQLNHRARLQPIWLEAGPLQYTHLHVQAQAAMFSMNFCLNLTIAASIKYPEECRNICKLVALQQVLGWVSCMLSVCLTMLGSAHGAFQYFAS